MWKSLSAAKWWCGLWVITGINGGMSVTMSISHTYTHTIIALGTLYMKTYNICMTLLYLFMHLTHALINLWVVTLLCFWSYLCACRFSLFSRDLSFCTGVLLYLFTKATSQTACHRHILCWVHSSGHSWKKYPLFARPCFNWCFHDFYYKDGSR